MAKRFAHETLIDTLQAMTGLDTDDVQVLLEPFLREYRKRAKDALDEAAFQSAMARAFGQQDKAGIVAQLSWIELFPYLLARHRVNHIDAAVYQTYRLYTNSNVIYYVSPHLTEAFFHTDFKIDFSQIRVPHETFIVYWGKGDHSVMLNNGTVPIHASFVDFVRITDTTMQIRQVYSYYDKDGDLCNSGITTITFDPNNLLLDSESFRKEVESTDYSTLNDMPVDQTHRQNNCTIYQLLWNLILYLNNLSDVSVHKPDKRFEQLRKMTNPKKRRRLEKELKDESPYRYTYVGANYDRRVQPHINEGAGTGRVLEHETIVRGHWRQQWYGPRRDSSGESIPGTRQEIIWIEPFVKGKGKGESEKTLVYRVR